MKRDTKQAASTKSEDGQDSKSVPRAKMAIPGPDIGTEFDGNGNRSRWPNGFRRIGKRSRN
jgi:hypothetical protein